MIVTLLNRKSHEVKRIQCNMLYFNPSDKPIVFLRSIQGSVSDGYDLEHDWEWISCSPEVNKND